MIKCVRMSENVQATNNNICSMLTQLFISRESSSARQIGKIDAALERLYGIQIGYKTKLAELKGSLKLLNDKSKRVDPNGMPRDVLIKNTKKRIVQYLNQNKMVQQNIDFFTNCKFNIENNNMTKLVVDNVKTLKKELSRVSGIDVEKVKDDVDDIAEMNEEMQEVNNTVNDTLINTWQLSIDDEESLLQAFLEESDEDEDEELQIEDEEESTKVADIYNPPSIRKLQQNPIVPAREPELIEDF